ncbi:MAG: hypothetical protein ACE5OO_02475 [Candidatus Bathyarchaeia archaeon]
MANEKELEELQRYLQDEDYKKLLCFCKEPKSWNEIRKLKMKQSKLFQILKDLKTAKALEFADGKYYSAAHTMEFIE